MIPSLRDQPARVKKYVSLKMRTTFPDIPEKEITKMWDYGLEQKEIVRDRLSQKDSETLNTFDIPLVSGKQAMKMGVSKKGCEVIDYFLLGEIKGYISPEFDPEADKTRRDKNGKVALQYLHAPANLSGFTNGCLLAGRLGPTQGFMIRLFFPEDTDANVFKPDMGSAREVAVSQVLYDAFKKSPDYELFNSKMELELEIIKKECKNNKFKRKLLQEYEGLEIEIVSMGKSDFPNNYMSQEDVSFCLENHRIPYEEFFSRLTEEGQKKLVHRIDFFYVVKESKDIPVENIPSGGYIISTSEKGVFQNGDRLKGYVREIFIEDTPIYVHHDNSPIPVHKRKLSELFKTVLGSENEILIKIAERMDAKSLKSLMQKLIRYSPKTVYVPLQDTPINMNREKEFDRPPDPKANDPRGDWIEISAEEMMGMCIVGLCTKPGYFIPELGAFVSGVQSVCKRLLVISGEDSYAPPDVMLQLAACSLMSQENSKWFPSLNLLKRLVKIGCDMIRETKYYPYQDHQVWKDFISKNKSPKDMGKMPESTNPKLNLQLCSSILSHIGSFEGDEILMWIIAYTNIKPVAGEIPQRVMPLWHYIDQHVFGDFLYFAEMNRIKHTSLEEMFTTVFKATGYNPRKSSASKDKELVEIRQWVNRMQLLSFMRLFQNVNVKYEGLKTRTFSRKLEDQWLASMVGDHQVGKKGYVACLDVMDIYSQPKVTLKPSRGKEVIPDEAQLLSSADEFDKILQKGVISKFAPHPSFDQAKIILEIDQDDNRSFKIQTKDGSKSWDEAREVSDNFKVVNDADNIFFDVMKTAGRDRCVRLLQWFSASDVDGFSIPHITRQLSGGGDHAGLRPAFDDINVYQILVEKIMEIYPSVIKPTDRIDKYEITNTLVFYHIKDLVIKYLRPANKKRMDLGLENKTLKAQPTDFELLKELESDIGVNKVWNPKGKTLMPTNRRNVESQNIAVLRLFQRAVKQSMLRDFLWMEPGAGKTSIILRVLRLLIKYDMLPNKVIYVLPRSAFETVISEIKQFGFEYNDFEGTGNKVDEIYNGKINLLEHDWVKERSVNVMKAVRECVLDSFCLFDEMHKAIVSTTQRSSNLQWMASACSGFVAFTGTPILSDKPMQLAGWLSLVLPYSVNSRNIWTSMGAIVSQPADVKIPTKINKVDITNKLVKDPEYGKVLRRLKKENDFLGFYNQVTHNYIYPEMAEQVRLSLRIPSSSKNLKGDTRRVAVVVYTQKDVEFFSKLLISKKMVKSEDIFQGGGKTKKRGFYLWSSQYKLH